MPVVVFTLQNRSPFSSTEVVTTVPVTEPLEGVSGFVVVLPPVLLPVSSLYVFTERTAISERLMFTLGLKLL